MPWCSSSISTPSSRKSSMSMTDRRKSSKLRKGVLRDLRCRSSAARNRECKFTSSFSARRTEKLLKSSHSTDPYLSYRPRNPLQYPTGVTQLHSTFHCHVFSARRTPSHDETDESRSWNIEDHAEPGDEGMGCGAIIAKEPCAHGGTVRQTGLLLPREPGVQCRFIGIIGRKAGTQLLRAPGRFFSMWKQWIFPSNEIAEKILQRAVSSIVRHDPNAHACAIWFGFADKPLSRNHVRYVQSNFAKSRRDRSPAILKRGVRVQHEADRPVVAHAYCGLDTFKEIVLAANIHDSRKFNRPTVSGRNLCHA